MLLGDYLGKKIKGEVGIEIECEGKNLPERTPEGSGWKATADGSLRGGIEYMLKGARLASQVPALLKELETLFKAHKTQLDFSFRTSVHVHVNCIPLTYTQIMNALYAYLIFEPVLIHYSGEGRKSNRFCLGLSDAEGFMDTLQMLFKFKEDKDSFPETLNYIREDDVKYSAINVGSLNKHGTIEIRSMRGTVDPAILVPWVNLLVAIQTWAINFPNPYTIYECFREVGVSKVFKMISGEDYEHFHYGNIEEDLNMNLSLTIDLPHTFKEMAKKKEKDELKPYKAERPLKKVAAKIPIPDGLRGMRYNHAIVDDLVLEPDAQWPQGLRFRNFEEEAAFAEAHRREAVRLAERRDLMQREMDEILRQERPQGEEIDW